MKTETALLGLYKKVRTIDEAFKPNGVADNRKDWRKKMISLNPELERKKYFKRVLNA